MKIVKTVLTCMVIFIFSAASAQSKDLGIYVSFGYGIGQKGSGLTALSTSAPSLTPNQEKGQYPSIGIGNRIEAGLDIGIYKNIAIRLYGGFSNTPTLEANSGENGLLKGRNLYSGYVDYINGLVCLRFQHGFFNSYIGIGGGLFRGTIKRKAEYDYDIGPSTIKYIATAEYKFQQTSGLVGLIGIEIPLNSRLMFLVELTTQNVWFKLEKCTILEAQANGKDVLDQIDLNPDRSGNQRELRFGENNTLMSSSWKLPGSSYGIRAGIRVSL